MHCQKQPFRAQLIGRLRPPFFCSLSEVSCRNVAPILPRLLGHWPTICRSQVQDGALISRASIFEKPQHY